MIVSGIEESSRILLEALLDCGFSLSEEELELNLRGIPVRIRRDETLIEEGIVMEFDSREKENLEYMYHHSRHSFAAGIHPVSVELHFNRKQEVYGVLQAITIGQSRGFFQGPTNYGPTVVDESPVWAVFPNLLRDIAQEIKEEYPRAPPVTIHK